MKTTKSIFLLTIISILFSAGLAFGEETFSEEPPVLIAPPSVDGASSELLSRSTSGTQAITPGFKWVRVRQVYNVIGNSYTWAWLEAPVNNWIYCNNNRCEDILLAAAASGNYLGVNFTGTTRSSFNHLRLYKN